MNWGHVFAVAKKDMKSITSNVQVMIGLILLPLLFGVIVPAVFIILAKTNNMTNINMNVGELIERFITQFPAGEIKDKLVSFPTTQHQIIYMFANYMLGPFFLLIPVLNALMISLNSLVGEKERRTLESLLFSPIDLKSLFLGKLIATFIPTIAVTIASFLLCSIIVNGLAYSMFDGLIFPNWNWIIILLWVTPMLTALVIQFSIMISARSKGFQEAQQLGGVIVLPIIALAISQITGLVFLSIQLLLAIGLVLLIINILMLKWVAKFNQRHYLFERQVH